MGCCCHSGWEPKRPEIYHLNYYTFREIWRFPLHYHLIFSGYLARSGHTFTYVLLKRAEHLDCEDSAQSDKLRASPI